MTSLTRTTRTRIAIPLVLAGALALGACENLNATQQRTLSGGAIGAGVGAVATAVTGGCISCGAVIGGAVGAGVGYVSKKMEEKNR